MTTACYLSLLLRVGFLAMIYSPMVFADDGKSLINTTPPEWKLEGWMNSKPLKLADFKGKVVLVRWWTAPGCPFCAATAPALNEFHELYKDRGLVVIGIYHHKSDQPLKSEDVVKQAEKLGFKFPVAIDPEWQTLKKWWIQTDDHNFTSVSLVRKPRREEIDDEKNCRRKNGNESLGFVHRGLWVVRSS
jgi:thiol-disulfide isomerase/thioredoxin